MRFSLRTTAAVGSAALLTFGLAACGDGERDQSGYYTTVPSPAYEPGSLISTELEMVPPEERGGHTIVTGKLLNTGDATSITGAETNVAHKVKLYNGETVVTEIPVPANAENAGLELTKDGYHFELEEVRMVIDNDGKISLDIFTDKDYVSSIEVNVVSESTSPSPSASVSGPSGSPTPRA